MTSSPTEKALDRALAKAIEAPGPFLGWLLGHTKFANRGATLIKCRCDHPWGKHPYTAIDQATGASVQSFRESETDVLVVLRASDGETLGVHIENKLGSGRFTADQPEMYAFRAKHWIGNAKYGGYSDFDTILLAPLEFKLRNSDQLRHFGCFVSHEDVATHVPEFAVSRRDA